MFFAAPGSAQACSGPAAETSLFHSKTPANLGPEDVVAEVVLETNNSRSGEARFKDGIVAKVIVVHNGNLKADEYVKLQFTSSSCGPWHEIGESGLIIGKRMPAATDDDLLVVVRPTLAKRGK